MGLFSSKKKTTVGTQVQRVVEDGELPETVKTSVIRALLADVPNASIPEYLINGFASTVALKAARAMDYGASEYAYGLPKSHISTTTSGEDIVAQVLETTLGFPITVERYELTPIDAMMVGWQALIENYGYDTVSNEITTFSTAVGQPCYLKDMQAVYTQASFDDRDLGVLDHWGPKANGGYTPERPEAETLGKYRIQSVPVLDESATEDAVEITYIFDDGTGTNTFVEQQLRIPIVGFDDDVEYHQVQYTYEVEIDPVGPVLETRTGFWIYEQGSGLYPTIDNIQDFPFDGLGQYFPFMYFRRDKEDMADPSLVGTPDYETSKRMLDLFNIDFVAVSEQVHENPDIDGVEQAMMVMAVSAEDPSEVGRRYLFDHFNALWATGNGAASFEDETSKGHQYAQVIADREFQMTLRHSGIVKRRKVGKIAEVGEHTSLEETVDVTDELILRALNGSETSYSVTNAEKVLIYRRQINPSVYDELRVMKPELLYHIYKDKKYKAGFGSDALIIPIDYSLLDDYSLPEREVLFARSMHFVFNTRVTQKVEWYQTGFFKAVMFVVAVAVAIYGGFQLGAAIYAAAQVGAVAVAKLLIAQIIIGLAIQEAAQIIVAEIGGEFALLLAAVATGVALAYSPGSLKGVKGAPWADELLMVATGLSRGVEAQTAELLEDLQKEVQTFQEEAEALTKLLEEAQDLLDSDSLINPGEFVGMAPFTIAGELPQDYYDRTIHSGNIGRKSIDAISEYVGAALTLPGIEDTLRSDFNAI